MRKLYPIAVAFLFTTMVSAQSGYPVKRDLTEGLVKIAANVGDFTITDSDGATWNLYQQLDQGKTVFVDLFFTT
jgi:cytochrome oxidase Cu insertion factor (SCO1/SenC/PrrC family)